MNIREEQLDALAQPAEMAFYTELAQFLRVEMPAETGALDDPALLDRVIDSAKRASTYGIESFAGVAQFTCLTFVAGPHFDAIKEINAYLTDDSMDAEEKLRLLIDELTDDAD